MMNSDMIQRRIEALEHIAQNLGSNWRLSCSSSNNKVDVNDNDNERRSSSSSVYDNHNHNHSDDNLIIDEAMEENMNLFSNSVGLGSCFPSLLLNHASYCPIQCQNLQELEQLAVNLLSQPIMVVHGHGSASSNVNEAGEEESWSYQVSHLNQVPEQMACNLCLSFMKLLRSRTKAYVVLLLRHFRTSNLALAATGACTVDVNDDRHYANDEDGVTIPCSTSLITDDIIEFLWHQTFVAKTTTTFQISAQYHNMSSHTEGTTTTLPLQLDAVLDVSIFGHARKVQLKTTGKLIGNFSDSNSPKLDHVIVDLDTSTLFKVMRGQIMDVVDRAMFNIKDKIATKPVTNGNSNTLSHTSQSRLSAAASNEVSEDDEEKCMEKIGSLENDQLEDVLDNVLQTADELHAISTKGEEAVVNLRLSSNTECMENIDHDSKSMPPPLPRKPKSQPGHVGKRLHVEIEEPEPPLVSPLLCGRSNTRTVTEMLLDSKSCDATNRKFSRYQAPKSEKDEA